MATYYGFLQIYKRMSTTHELHKIISVLTDVVWKLLILEEFIMQNILSMLACGTHIFGKEWKRICSTTTSTDFV